MYVSLQHNNQLKNINMKAISTNQTILNQLIEVANQVFTENEKLFKPFGVAFTLSNVIKTIEIINQSAYNKPYQDNTEIVIESGTFRCSFIRQDVFNMLQKFSRLPECKLDKNFMFTISEIDSRIEKIKVYDTKKDGTLKQTTVLVEFLSDTFAFESGKGDYAKMYYIVDGIGYYQGKNSKGIAEQRAKQTGNNHDFAISGIKSMIERNDYFGQVLYLLAVNLGFEPAELDANNEKFNESKSERTRLYNEVKEEEKRIKAEKQECEKQERIAEKQKEVSQTKRAFLDGKYISVDNFRGLCSEFNINIAPKTIDMLNKKITDISTNGIRYYANCKRKPNAENLFSIIATLKDLLLEQEQISENPDLYMTDSRCDAFLNGTLSETNEPEITVSDQTETFYPVIIPFYCTIPALVDHSDVPTTENETIYPVIIKPAINETKHVTPVQIQLQPAKTIETDRKNIILPAWIKYVACFIAGLICMHFLGDIEQAGQTVNAATINQPDITINVTDTVYIAEPVYTIDPVYIIEVETIELITVDIIGLIEPVAIDIEPSHESDISHATQSQDTQTEYKTELLPLPNTQQIKVHTFDISNVLNEKITVSK